MTSLPTPGRVSIFPPATTAAYLTVAALARRGDRIDLAGTLLGGASGRYDAGGTEVPYDGGELVVRARQLQDSPA